MRSALFAAAFLLSAGVAHAHFKLNAPAASLMQNALGDPQKAGPCGGAGTATNMVTNYTPGGMLTLTVDETVDHPGHYRVALAATEAMLPPPPTVTGANCGAAAIAANPTLPILADGLFANLTAANPEATVQIQLPEGFECPNCVLQVVQFMSAHAEPCFYYHCATVNISASAPPPDAGVDPMPDAGTNSNNPNGTTGGCSTGGGAGVLVGFALLGLVMKRRRS